MATLNNTFRTEILKEMMGLSVSSTIYLDLQTSGGNILATFSQDMSAPGVFSNGVMTFQTPKEVTAFATGTASKARLRYVSGGVDVEVITNMTVGTSSSFEIQMADTSITSGQPVQLTSFSITAPADVTVG